MGPLYLSLCVIFMCLGGDCIIKAAEIPFNENYIPIWGDDHISILDRGTQVQIRIDPLSGGGFRSRHAYGSGYFRMSIKVPKNSKGIATTFYLTSVPDNGRGVTNHDELDFELLGQNGPPYILNTNVFAQDTGNREQQFNLWFDPTLAFHDYEILWNQKQIVLFIDKVPIRVFKNNEKVGARYPKLPMYLHASLWNGTQWLGPVDWKSGPFFANYGGFKIHGCPYKNYHPTKCDSPNYTWNAHKNWQLDAEQQKVYESIKNKHMMYDYCKSKFANNFPECRIGGS
ncbi:hypothetical protein Pfo_020931 [Paulownia fortunei]|nr:hypothetical protein Pfo_020931 [Paulownia fortunei]